MNFSMKPVQQRPANQSECSRLHLSRLAVLVVVHSGQSHPLIMSTKYGRDGEFDDS